MTDAEEILEQLEAKVKAHDADIEDLGLVVKDEYEETQDENETLREENSELKEEIESVKELYADALAEATGLDADFFMDKGLDELQDLHDEKCDEELVDTPAPASGDVTPEEEENQKNREETAESLQAFSDDYFTNEELRRFPREVEVEDVEDLKDIIQTYEQRGGYWESAAEPYREALEEIEN